MSHTPETKICPDCAEEVKTAARKCRFCGCIFDVAPVESAPVLSEEQTPVENEPPVGSATAGAFGWRRNGKLKPEGIILMVALALIGMVFVSEWKAAKTDGSGEPPEEWKTKSAAAIANAKAHPMAQPVDHSIEAYHAAQDIIRSKLKYPDDANFPFMFNAIHNQLEDGSYQFRTYVKAENAFGVKRKLDWICELKEGVNNQWTVTGVCDTDEGLANAIIRQRRRTR